MRKKSSTLSVSENVEGVLAFPIRSKFYGDPMDRLVAVGAIAERQKPIRSPFSAVGAIRRKNTQ